MFAGPIIFLVIIVTCAYAEESLSNDVSQEKRAPMGFQGMRGKKDLTSSENDEYSKRAPMGFQVNRDQAFKARLSTSTFFSISLTLSPLLSYHKRKIVYANNNPCPSQE